MVGMTKEEVDEPSKALGALGVVFGDIGTSPLYALPAAFWLGHFNATPENIFGIVSMIIWAITIIVAIKYITLMMQADNDGEGGIMALVALLRRAGKKTQAIPAKRWAVIGLVGVALFYGDSVITPAISVLSAVEGIQISVPGLADWTAPIALAVLTILFMLQSRGTAKLGTLFGPIMLLWFGVSAVAGGYMIRTHPEILWALSPVSAITFITHNPASAFIALGAVVLAITGAEALYADMGHFGRRAVTSSWFVVVYPALILNYLGQGALLLGNPQATVSTYFYLFPDWAQLFAVVLATVATLIASQSVIAGAFSLTRQAVQLGYLPRLRIVHTSNESGQIYIAGLNWGMYVMVALLVVLFGTSARLSDAYGMAESGTLLASTILLMAAARTIWKTSYPWVYLLGIGLLVIEGSFVVACSAKLIHGAWIPLAIALLVLIVLVTWAQGSEIIAAERRRREGKLDIFVHELSVTRDLVRTPGTTIYLTHHAGYTPLALRATVERLHELSKSVVVVTVQMMNAPHIPLTERATVNSLGSTHDGIVSIILQFGFDDVPNIPLALEHLQGTKPELKLDLNDATYFISESDVALRRHPQINYLRAQLFTALHRISAPSPVYFRLPPERTIDMASYVEL